MSVRVFLDSNIFLYAVDAEAGEKGNVARQLIRSTLASQTGSISYQVVQEYLNGVLKKFSVSVPREEVEKYLNTVLPAFHVVHSSFPLFSEAMQIFSRYRLSWYDSLLVAAAVEGGSQVLYTEDLQHGARINGVRIENPFRSITH